MDNVTINERVRQLRDLEMKMDALKEEMEAIKSELKEEMHSRGEYVLKGDDWKITWNSVSSNRFNQSMFKEEHPDLFKQYVVLSESRRFNLSTY